MARGAKQPSTATNGNALPKFVDVKLSPEDKVDFLRQVYSPADLVQFLTSVCDDGYRVGCTWSAEQQAYTVSLTCRDPKSVNSGLCMTSFAKDLPTAVALTQYKHVILTEENWLGSAGPGSEDFG